MRASIRIQVAIELRNRKKSDKLSNKKNTAKLGNCLKFG